MPVLVVPLPEIVAGSVALFVLAVPLGLLVLEAVERWGSRPLPLTPLERILLAFYATGGVLFVLAALPFGTYGLALVAAALTIGIGARVVRWARTGWDAPRRYLAWARTLPALAIALGTLGLLVWEGAYTANVPLGNGVDGAVHSLFVQLLLAQHSLPFTLQPYADIGVTYPQGAPVWESLAPLLFSWPVTSAPIVLSPLFLSLTVPATYCLGERLAPTPFRGGLSGGLLYAAFFGVLATWPRMLVGGSYDFAFGFPLMIVILGLLPGFFSRPDRALRDAVILGGGIGCAAVISGSVGLAFAILLPVFWLAFSPKVKGWIIPGVQRIVLALAVATSFEARSIGGVIAWFAYPAHVLMPLGNPPYASPSVSNPLSYRNVTGELDPFILWKYKLSPVAGQSLMLAVLLAVGLALVAIWWWDQRGSLGRLLGTTEVRTAIGGVLALFALTATILLGAAANTASSGIPSVVNPDETSLVLFFFFQIVALLPLIVAARFFARTRESRRTPQGGLSPTHKAQNPRLPTARSRPFGRVAALAAAAVVLAPLLVGTATTLTLVPGALAYQVDSQANISSGDIAALQWAGARLPPCSTVLVAPGSAAQYLPEFATLHVDFPSFPAPYNGSYWVAVNGLTAGIYDPSVRAALLSLGITEVFVTGQTTPEFGAFSPLPMEQSSDFTMLYNDSDAYIFAFAPGEAGSACAP